MPRTHRVLLCILVAVLAARGLPSAAEDAEGVVVPRERIAFDDGDSFAIRWPEGIEVVRILGIDAPEVQHLEHDLPYAQPFGERAAGFLEGCLAVADEVRLLRSGERDAYGRTLGYLLVDGRNYAALIVAARLAVETVSHYGDNGMPARAAEVTAAAKTAGPVAFEPPYRYRQRMREVAAWMRENGTYPLPKADETSGAK